MRASGLILAAVAGLLLVGAAAPSAGPGETPAHFVQRLSATYRDGSPRWASDQKAQAVYQNRVYADFYDPTFVKVVNSKVLAVDPVCQCTGDESSGNTYSYVSGQAKGAFFDAKVRGDVQGGAPTPWTLVLSKTAAGWRIYDVINQDGSSARTQVTRYSACLRAAKTQKAKGACAGEH